MRFFEKMGVKGVAAIEFALIFPVLFLMLYGLITYSIIFAVQHSLNLAAAEGARASVRYQSQNDKLELRRDAACQAIEKNLSWIKGLGVEVSCPSQNNGAVLVVDPQYSEKTNGLYEMDISLKFQYAKNPILPVIFPVPEDLTAHAVSQFSLSF